MRFLRGLPLLLLAGVLPGQTFSNQTLNTKYYFRHLFFTTDAAGSMSDIRSLSGAITFNGVGNYSFTGQQTIRNSAAISFSGSGTYAVSPAGMVTLSNPQDSTLNINARYGWVGINETVILGSTTESTRNVFDLFVAVQAVGGASMASLKPSYWVSALSFPGGIVSKVRNSLFQLNGNGQGLFSDIDVSGHAANVLNGVPGAQTVSGATYSINADATGTATFPLQAGRSLDTQLLNGNETIYVSANGNMILGGSRDPGVHDILVGFQSRNGLAWANKFWHASLRFDTVRLASSYSGSLFSTGGGTLTFTRREHQAQSGSTIQYDFTGANSYHLQADGSGTVEFTRVGLGADGNGFLGAAIDPEDPSGYELYLGIHIPGTSGTGVFLDPQGVVNAASFAPVGESIAPGEYLALFGTGLASETKSATIPYPASFGGVTVLVNNLPAPIQYISNTQLNILVPYAISGPTATIVVSSNGQPSNAVQVPVAATAPGIFSLDRNGIGPGAVLHTDFTLVSSNRPAKRGETVLIYLAGLGAVDPAVADGAPGGSTTLSKARAVVNVLMGGIPATVSFAGLAPLFPGLYQLNVTVPGDLTVSSTRPVPLAIQTSDSFHDQVDLIVGP